MSEYQKNCITLLKSSYRLHAQLTSNAKSLACQCDTANEHALERHSGAVRQSMESMTMIYIHIATVGNTIQTVNCFPNMNIEISIFLFYNPLSPGVLISVDL